MSVFKDLIASKVCIVKHQSLILSVVARPGGAILQRKLGNNISIFRRGRQSGSSEITRGGRFSIISPRQIIHVHQPSVCQQNVRVRVRQIGRWDGSFHRKHSPDLLHLWSQVLKEHFYLKILIAYLYDAFKLGTVFINRRDTAI
jgi:hypothetical protein